MRAGALTQAPPVLQHCLDWQVFQPKRAGVHHKGGNPSHGWYMDILKFPPRNLTPLRGLGWQGLCTPGNATQMDPGRATGTQKRATVALSPMPGGWKGAQNMGAPGKNCSSPCLSGLLSYFQRTSPHPSLSVYVVDITVQDQDNIKGFIP